MCAILTYCGKSETMDKVRFETLLERTRSRGPDRSRVLVTEDGYLGFNRLSIMGLDESGMQPFTYGDSAVVCNGELYGFAHLKDYLQSMGETFVSDSDCEILLPLYARLGCAMFGLLDAEFALVIYDGKKGTFVAARDPIGIRPLYYGYDAAGVICFASEPKNLIGLCDAIHPFPPGHY